MERSLRKDLLFGAGYAAGAVAIGIFVSWPLVFWWLFLLPMLEVRPESKGRSTDRPL